MCYIIILLVLPMAIKIFFHFLTLKLKLIPKKNISAEMIIEDMNRRKCRSCKVEKQYIWVYSAFNKKLKNREITREQMVAVREYLNLNVKQYTHKTFKNDAHAIYTMLKAKDITIRDLKIVYQLIA